MRSDPRSLSLAARMEPHDIVRYAQARGWVLARSVQGPFLVLSHPESDLDQVLVPRSVHADDFALRLPELGMKESASVKDPWGSLYAVGACTLGKVMKENPDLARGYAQALKQTVTWMNANPDKAAEMLSKSVDNKVNWPPKNGRYEVCYVDLVEVV